MITTSISTTNRRGKWLAERPEGDDDRMRGRRAGVHGGARGRGMQLEYEPTGELMYKDDSGGRSPGRSTSADDMWEGERLPSERGRHHWVSGNTIVGG